MDSSGRVGAMEGLARSIEACAEAVGALNELETAWFALGRGVGCAWYVTGCPVSGSGMNPASWG